MKPLTVRLLKLVDQPYDTYNTILPQIKEALYNADVVGDQRLATFERVLAEELPLTTGRRAFRTAVCMAMGEEEGFCREYRPAEQSRKSNKAKK